MADFRYKFILVIAVIGVAAALVVGFGIFSPDRGPEVNLSKETRPGFGRLDFSRFNPGYRFAGDIPSSWQVEYVSAIDAVNIYDPSAEGHTNLEKSQIFVRNFEAAKFLTLTTVDVLSRQETQVKGQIAVKYVIEKKAGVANFPSQPPWRNMRHEVIDVRLTNNNPSLFYVIARSPELAEEKFKDFIDSLVFHNDAQSFVLPVERAAERITKKPFGLKVAPGNSPVEPERFSGYHTGLDFETFEEEEKQEVVVFAICGGSLRQSSPASGYGGVAVQECLLRNQPITVIYGHLKLSSVRASVGDYLAPGQKLGVLGNRESEETDGERKHLHLGILKGNKIDLSGYATTDTELSRWFDPAPLLFP